MVLPILPLFSSAMGRLGSFTRIFMEFQRVIFVDDRDFVFVGFTNFGEFTLNSSAVRSLEVGELDNRYRRIRRATRRPSIKRKIEKWRLQEKLYTCRPP